MTPLLHGTVRSGRFPSSNRLLFIDVARGSAMLFVLLSHFSFTYFPHTQGPLPTMMTLIGMVASPTFMTINGMMIGYFYRTRGPQFDRLRPFFTDRGLFLLTVGHLLILASHASYAVRFLSITDTLGICMLVMPTLVTVLRARYRLGLAMAVYAIAEAGIIWWQPATHVASIMKETFFGTYVPGVYTYAFPVQPWLSLNLAASAVGERLGTHSNHNDERAMLRFLLKTGACAVAAAVVLNGAYHVLSHAGHVLTAVASYGLHSPFEKWPPSPVYFLFYGGIGLMLIAASLRVSHTAGDTDIVRGLAILGQTSFALFVIQYFVYFEVFPVVRHHLPWQWAWPVYFALSIPAIVIPDVAWHKGGCNRFLTVGYRRWAISHTSPEEEHPATFGVTEPVSLAR